MSDEKIGEIIQSIEKMFRQKAINTVNYLLTKDQQASWAKCLTATCDSTGVNFRSSYGIVLTYSFL